MREGDKLERTDVTPLDYGRSVRTKKPVHRLVAVSVVLAAIIVFGAILLPAFHSPRVYAPQVTSRSNLWQIGLAIAMYRQDNGKYPDTLADLIGGRYIVARGFVSPMDKSLTPAQGANTDAIVADFNAGGHCSYFYLGRDLPPRGHISSDVIICYEPSSAYGGTGMNILFPDGHVEWVDANAAKVITGQIAIGVRPVRWPIPAATMPGN